jgi:hypothetical protein
MKAETLRPASPCHVISLTSVKKALRMRSLSTLSGEMVRLQASMSAGVGFSKYRVLPMLK